MDDDSVGEEEEETNTTAEGGARNANKETGRKSTDKGNNGDLTKHDEEGNALISIGCYTGTRCVVAGAGISLCVCWRTCACACTSKAMCAEEELFLLAILSQLLPHLWPFRDIVVAVVCVYVCSLCPARPPLRFIWLIWRFCSLA